MHVAIMQHQCYVCPDLVGKLFLQHYPVLGKEKSTQVTSVEFVYRQSSNTMTLIRGVGQYVLDDVICLRKDTAKFMDTFHI